MPNCKRCGEFAAHTDVIGEYLCGQCRTEDFENGTGDFAPVGVTPARRMPKCAQCGKECTDGIYEGVCWSCGLDNENNAVVVDKKFDVNEDGGRQSKLYTACGLLDGPAILVLSGVLYGGKKTYGKDNWRLIPEEDHIDHALEHLMRYLAEEDDEDHLAHAFCRIMMAVALRERPDYRGAQAK